MSLETTAVVMGNDAEVVPGRTLTLEGTLATGELPLERATVAPGGGAGPESVTVPVEPVPPTTEAGDADSDEGGGWRRTLPCRAAEPSGREDVVARRAAVGPGEKLVGAAVQDLGRRSRHGIHGPDDHGRIEGEAPARSSQDSWRPDGIVPRAIGTVCG